MSEPSLPLICKAIQDLCNRTRHHFDSYEKLGAMDVLMLQALFLEGEAKKMLAGNAVTMASDTLNALNNILALQYALGKLGQFPGYAEPSPQDYEVLKEGSAILDRVATVNDSLAGLRESSGMYEEAGHIRVFSARQRWLKEALEGAVGGA